MSLNYVADNLFHSSLVVFFVEGTEA